MEYQVGGIQEVIWLWKLNQLLLVTYPTAMCSQISDFIQVSTFPPCGSDENPDSS